MDSRGAAEGLWEASDFVELARSVESVETHFPCEVEKQLLLQKPRLLLLSWLNQAWSMSPNEAIINRLSCTD
jgi:hypothetical protein